MTDERNSKRRAGDDDDEEMEVEDDDDDIPKKGMFATAQVPLISSSIFSRNRRTYSSSQMHKLTARSNRRRSIRPVSTVRLVVQLLFPHNYFNPNLYRYKGFLSTQIAPNSPGDKTKSAMALFESPELASVAKEALDGFALKKGWLLGVSYS